MLAMVERQAFKARGSRLRKRLGQEGMGGVVIVPGPNMRYLTDVESFLLERPFMLLVSTSGGAHLVAPELESGPYRRSAMDITVHSWTDAQGPRTAIEEATGEAGFEGTWGVEGKAPFAYLEKLTAGRRIKLRSAEQILQGLREVKDEAEMRTLRRSCSILSRSFREFPGLLREGITEIELAKAATETIQKNGAVKVEDMLVQSGRRAADPHSLPSSKKIRREESIVMDVGTSYLGYYSDITRTFCLGTSNEFVRVYDEVLEGQKQGIHAARAGVEVGAVDRAARHVIEKAGYGKEFFHRTGHGLGLEIHEGPYIVTGGKQKLANGMYFTVEPGVYLRGRLGVRIEDDVLIYRGLGEEVTKIPKEYGWWR
jgi:Xaa-Pro aminopeptidase